MKLPIKTRKQSGLNGKPVTRTNIGQKAKEVLAQSTKTNRIKTSFSSTENVGNTVSEIKRKSRELQAMILEVLTNPFSELNIIKVMEKVKREKPEKIMDMARAVLPKDINIEVEEKRFAPVIIPALNRNLVN